MRKKIKSFLSVLDKQDMSVEEHTEALMYGLLFVMALPITVWGLTFLSK